MIQGSFLDSVELIATRGGSLAMRILGPCLVVGLYAIVGVHVYAYFTVITPLLKDRVGTFIGMVWIIVGLSLVYNIVFNHLLAVIIKPGGPSDTVMIEEMRRKQKNRSNRKEIESARDERFVGLSSNVK